MAETIILPSWKSLCYLFAKQTADRYQWNAETKEWMALSNEAWVICDFNADIFPVWLLSFSAVLTKRAYEMPDHPVAVRLRGLCDSTKWTDPDVKRMLREYCQAVWAGPAGQVKQMSLLAHGTEGLE